MSKLAPYDTYKYDFINARGILTRENVESIINEAGYHANNYTITERSTDKGFLAEGSPVMALTSLRNAAKRLKIAVEITSPNDYGDGDRTPYPPDGNLADEYTIYLQNESESTQVFWFFLERPEELISDPLVYANSDIHLAVSPHSPSVDTFTVPVQYLVGAGAGNNAVGLDVRIDSTIIEKAHLGEEFSAVYADVPPNQGPTLSRTGTGAGENSLSISSNPFDQANNEANGWYSNMSFGIQTAQGFAGMTWSPNPNQRRTLTPTLTFYVAVGEFGQNRLASWTTVSIDSAELVVPRDFAQRKATVTYTSRGQWVVTPGAPSLADSIGGSAGGSLGNLIESQRLLAQAQSNLLSLSTGYAERQD
ncbi:MAG: hypothetical protein AAGD01_17325 [Acidobacteriota bacterium]